MRSEMIKGFLALSLGGALIGGVLIARPALAQDDLPDGPGKAVLRSACSSCHGVSQVTGEHQTREQWSSTVTMMMNNGANVPDAQFDTLVDYLAANFGTGPAPAAGATVPPAGGTAPAPTPPAAADATAPAPAPTPAAQ